LGRRSSHQPFEHRREILRPIWSNANANPDFYGNPDSDGDSNSYTYFDTETFTDTKSCANAQAASYSAAAPVTFIRFNPG